MATERKAPDAILELSNLSGTVSEIQDDPDDPDGDWLDASENNVDTVCHVSFPTPTGPPTVGADLQEFRVLVRKYGGTGTPTARIELYEDGSLVRAGSDIDVTGEQVIAFTWNANELGTADGSLVECRVFGDAVGGAPATRATVEVGAVEWNVDYSTGVTHYGSATLSGTGAAAAAGAVFCYAAASPSGTGALAAAGTLIAAGSASLSGTGTVTAAGSIFCYAAAPPSGTGSLAAAAAVIHTGQATASGTGSLTAAAAVIHTGAAQLSGVGTVTCEGTIAGLTGSATLSGTGSLAAAGHVTRYGSATLSGTATVTAAAMNYCLAAATIYGTGIIAAAAVMIRHGAGTLSGTGALTAAAIAYTISPTLVAAQQARHRTPHVELRAYDYERGIKRLYFTRLYNGSEADNHHGIAFDGQGSMHRIRADTASKLYHQKITNPGPSSDYSSWTEIASDCAGPCAIAAYGAKVYIFYRKTDNTLRKYYSHNYGGDWTNAELSTYADVLSLAAAWWGTGDIVVCFALASGTPGEINGITLDTTDQTTTPHTWDDGNHPWLATYGLGATYDAYMDAINLVIACKESDSPYNHYDLHRTKFTNTYNFLAIESFLMAPEGEDVTFEYPDCHLPSSPADYETTKVLAVEKYTGVTAYTRPLTSHLVKGTSWSDTTFVEPRPFMDISPAYGLRVQSTSAYWWISMPSGIWTAPRPAADPLDLSTRIITAMQNKPGQLIIDLDNSDGYFATPGQGAVAALTRRAELRLRLGYRTTAGAESHPSGEYWIDAWEYSHAPNVSTFTITALDGWGLIDRWTARYQMRWNKDEVDPTTVWQIMYQVLARVGIRLTNSPPKPRSSPIDNFYPDFTINPGTPGDAAIRQLLTFVPDGLVFRGNEAFTKNPVSTEESCYDFGPDDHVILSGRYGDRVTLSRTRALGMEDDEDRILEEALDWDALDLSIDDLAQDYDPNLATATRAQERADAILRRSALRAKDAQITVPTRIGQELLDVVTATDPRCGIDELPHRVLALRTDYDRRTSRYHQVLTLGAP